jgi:hypothetical protein
MDFSLIPTAEASITTLVNSISKVILNPIIIFLFAAAVAYFLYGVVQYLMNPDNEEVRKKSKSQMVWGIIGLFIMVGVFGIMTLIKNTVGAKNITTPQSDVVAGSSDYLLKSTGTLDQFTGVSAMTLYECNTSGNIWDIQSNKCTLDTEGSGGYQNTGNDYQSSQVWLSYTGGGYQSTGGIYQSTGNISNTFLGSMDPFSRSTKNSKLIGKYSSDSLYYRVVDSGVSPVLDEAKKIALNNALIQIAKLKGLTSTIGIKYRVIEQTEFPLDTITGNYDSFIAVESPTNTGSSSYGSSSY